MKIETTLPLKGRRLLIAASGSIAAVKTTILVSNLIKAGAQVQCLVTPSASKLVSPLALANLSRNRCYQDKDQWDANEPRPLHIALAEWAEVVVIAPMSASTLGRWINGLGEGLLASLLLACERPVVAAAAMNTAMWNNPGVKNNWEQLKTNQKVLTLEPEEGLLACNRIGDGRMVHPDLIELAINSALMHSDRTGHLKRDFSGQKILVTAGPTLERLDQARNISNRSSGLMGVLLAQAARFRGGDVDLVHGPLSISKGLLEGLKSHQIYSAAEMQVQISELQPFAKVIAMTAAVADIRRKGLDEIKDKINKRDLISSLGKELELVPDLLAEIVKRRSANQIILGFAALTGNDAEIRKIGEQKRQMKGCDLLMANPIDKPGQGFETNTNGGWLLGFKGKPREIPVTTKLDVAHQLLDAIHEITINNSGCNSS